MAAAFTAETAFLHAAKRHFGAPRRTPCPSPTCSSRCFPLRAGARTTSLGSTLRQPPRRARSAAISWSERSPISSRSKPSGACSGRARGHGRAHSGQDRRLEEEGHVDGRLCASRLCQEGPLPRSCPPREDDEQRRRHRESERCHERNRALTQERPKPEHSYCHDAKRVEQPE